MAAITWKNIANTVTGDSAASLNAATNAFAESGKGIERLREQAVKREDDRVADVNDDELQRLFGVGDLAGVDKEANFGDILKSSNKQKLDASGIAANESSTAVNNQNILVSQLNNSPEARKRKEDAEDLRNEQNTQTFKNSEVTFAQRQKAVAKQERYDANEVEINEDWAGHVGEKLQGIKDIAADEIGRLSGLNMDPAAQQAAIQKVRQKLTSDSQQITQSEAINWTNQWQIDNDGLSNPGIKRSVPFMMAASLTEQGQEEAKLERAHVREVQQKRGDVIEDVLAGGRKNMNALGRTSDSGRMTFFTNPGDIKANTITQAKAASEMLQRGKNENDWTSSIDDAIAPQYRQQLDDIVDAVGGNRMLYDKVMQGVKYNRDWNLLPFGMGEDDITGLPSIDAVNDIVDAELAKASAIWEERDGAETPSPKTNFLPTGTDSSKVDQQTDDMTNAILGSSSQL